MEVETSGGLSVVDVCVYCTGDGTLEHYRKPTHMDLNGTSFHYPAQNKATLVRRAQVVSDVDSLQRELEYLWKVWGQNGIAPLT